jgi:APA family basic amino acid/polyamine antiporter
MRASKSLFGYELGRLGCGVRIAKAGESCMSTNAEATSAATVDPAIDLDLPRSGRQLGLPIAIALVVGNMIGAGIFVLPAALAPYGDNAIIGWLITIGGSMCLAFTLARLAGRIPGGPFAYVETAFGPEAGFVVMWSYLISIWSANAALPIAAVSNFSNVWPALGGATAPALAVAFVWILTLVNAQGARTAGFVSLIASVLKALPLIAVALVAAAYLGRGGHPAARVNVPISPGFIAGAAALSVFPMVGFESATLLVGKIRNSQRAVPLATVLGTGLTGLIYLAATWAVFYMLPGNKAAMSASPFADAIRPSIGAAAGGAIAIFAAISALGALNGWILCSGEVPLTLARDGVFPAWFGRTTRIGTPVRGQLVAGAAASLLILSNYTRSLTGLFAFMTLISTVAALVLYAACAAAALRLLVRGAIQGILLGALAAAGLGFALWSFWGAGLEPTLWGAGLLATGIPIWWIMRRNRRRAKDGSSRLAAETGGAPPE